MRLFSQSPARACSPSNIIVVNAGRSKINLYYNNNDNISITSYFQILHDDNAEMNNF